MGVSVCWPLSVTLSIVSSPPFLQGEDLKNFQCWQKGGGGLTDLEVFGGPWKKGVRSRFQDGADTLEATMV